MVGALPFEQEQQQQQQQQREHDAMSGYGDVGGGQPVIEEVAAPPSVSSGIEAVAEERNKVWFCIGDSASQR